eukprot:913473-Prymnesium_polylepis.2
MVVTRSSFSASKDPSVMVLLPSMTTPTAGPLPTTGAVLARRIGASGICGALLVTKRITLSLVLKWPTRPLRPLPDASWAIAGAAPTSSNCQ